MLTMNNDLEGALKAYLECLDIEEYFEAHEVLEEAWHPLRLQKHPLANLVKGLINAAIAFEHIKRNKSGVKEKVQKVIVSYERHKYLSQDSIAYGQLFKMALEKIEALKLQHTKIFQ